jgi:hypothetical protein
MTAAQEGLRELRGDASAAAEKSYESSWPGWASGHPSFTKVSQAIALAQPKQVQRSLIAGDVFQLPDHHRPGPATPAHGHGGRQDPDAVHPTTRANGPAGGWFMKPGTRTDLTGAAEAGGAGAGGLAGLAVQHRDPETRSARE